MAHLRKQIRDNVVTTLTWMSTTCRRVYANRVYPMAAANLPGLCVYAKSEEVETTAITRSRTQVRILRLPIKAVTVWRRIPELKVSKLSMSMKAPYCRSLFSTAPQRQALAKSVARLEDSSPASPVGELIDVIVKEIEASNQSNSQGAADADVQAKEGAWELFTV